MRRTESLRLQHAELARQATALAAALDTASADQLRAQIAELVRALTQHAHVEDERLYPALMQHKDDGIRTTASALHADFGVIYASLEVFLTVWSRPGAIEGGGAQFARETRHMLDTLAMRMRLEEDELYALVDALP